MEYTYNESELSIYISYDYLKIKDYSEILASINSIYESLSKMFLYPGLEYIEPYDVMVYPIPLCLEEVHTGNSIDFKISFSKKVFPSLNIKKERIDIELPKWSAILLLTGAILSYGIDQWDKIESIRNNRLDSTLKNMEIKSKFEKNNSESNELKMNYYHWNQIIQQINIHKVIINNQEVKSKNN